MSDLQKTRKGLSLKKITIKTSVRAGKPSGTPSGNGVWPPNDNRPKPHFPPGNGGN
jgi:hypothetical protein